MPNRPQAISNHHSDITISFLKQTTLEGGGSSATFCCYTWAFQAKGVLLCPCVHPSVHLSLRKLDLVHTITRHKFQLESLNLHQTYILGYTQLILKTEIITQNHQMGYHLQQVMEVIWGPGLSLDILKMESWTYMGRTANIIIKDIIHVSASISKILHILLMGRRNREHWGLLIFSHNDHHSYENRTWISNYIHVKQYSVITHRVISVKLGQYHGCWCQDISSHDIDYIE